MTNGSEGIAEYPGRPDYTALIRALRVDALGDTSIGIAPDPICADAADAVEALVAQVRQQNVNLAREMSARDALQAERDALREQLAAAKARLAGMTDEWGAGYASHPENRPVQVCNDEATASAYADGRGRDGEFRFHVVKRLVGPWAEYRAEATDRG